MAGNLPQTSRHYLDAMRTMRLAASLMSVAMLAACGVSAGGADDGKKPPAKTSGNSTATIGSASGPASTMIEVVVDPPEPDAPCNGKLGIEIPAVESPEVRSEPVTVPDQTLAGRTIPGFVIPGVHIPAQHIPAQCAERAPAPAGCIGAVTIPAVTIPGVTIPAVEISAVNVAGAPSQPAVAQSERVQPPVRQAALTSPGMCILKVQPGSYQPSVYQPSTYRPSVYRPSVYRPSVYRPSVCVGSDCIPSVNVPSLNVPSVNVPSVNVVSTQLAGKMLPEITSACVTVLEGSGATAYNVCSDVLFDSGKADIRPAAAAALTEVVRSLTQRSPDGNIAVDGHTDSQGTDADNNALSVRRAEAVKRWLGGHGIAATRISVQGYGESKPVASNADASGQQRNRRVVIGVVAPAR